jgi:hypothetical protein
MFILYFFRDLLGLVVQVALSHVLAVNVAGTVGVQVLDSLVLVHSLQVSTQGSTVFYTIQSHIFPSPRKK